MTKRLEGKVALISGGAQGMGASHARAIVSEGGRVVIGDIDESAAAAVLAELGDDIAFVRLDVSSTDEWDAAVRTAVERFGKLDVLVNNAGILVASPIEDFSDDDWERTLAVNLTGAFKGIRAAVPELARSAPSSIINISSTAGLKGFPGIAAYNSTKFGVRGLTKSTAIELAERGIRVNSIHPGNINTRMIEGLYDGYPHVPMRRAGDVEEISRLVVFLACEESSFSTGAEFVADGGETAGAPDPFA
ncbi:3-alpha-(or 20-beta)-hydroxysteroid dehydrogenase [Cnuibacter physcomitrellae]|uniref:3-alpha-hydroxysteroid dehydrogenase n=1 Tax=Cnuibacter physcomitrellae TaxID=1619308 RepID=A0A1X9LWL3_9MICO|nr:glucose 1-dehydrogenase [Cnuibacter physcomitrellae]ARJ07689.1 3-alpha-hydroxysteroid dehydrogenase [Cnuibacter physcomitrellae]GGI42592.1 3-alpha-(or 20-beta)-hydroxysteroid dehydrogenase [Cnuibacter physcomitrellae]